MVIAENVKSVKERIAAAAERMRARRSTLSDICKKTRSNMLSAAVSLSSR